jgi:flagellar biogenesis protein FliO
VDWPEIILALIFQAHWRLITLLLIVLAACTVLPKLARKWFWLSEAAIALMPINEYKLGSRKEIEKEIQ